MKFLLLFLVLAAGGAQASAPRLVETARIVWSESDPRFGGLSGVEITDGGKSLLAVGDKGIWVTANLGRDPSGKLRRAKMTGIGKLRGVGGNVLRQGETDAEGLDLDEQGRAYVSFEAMHRVRRYDSIDGPATSIPDYREFDKLSGNSSLESVTVGPDGTIYTLPERERRPTSTVPVFRFRDGQWSNDLRLPRGEGFHEVDADFGPDGRFYLLERRFKWMGGFSSRLRSFALGPDGFSDERLLLKTRFGELDNMEGISVWRDDEGRTRVTLISDDNFFPLQRTYLIEYIVETE